MANFKKAFKRTIELEGGYSNHPSDPGGETIYGISKKHHPEMWKNGVPSKKEAEGFYKRKFWDVVNGDEIDSQSIAEELFDTSVNVGTGRAVRFLQQAYNVCNTTDPDLKVDGVVGPVTTKAVNEFTKSYTTALFNCMNGLQFQHYYSLVLNRQWSKEFFRGWMQRIEALEGNSNGS